MRRILVRLLLVLAAAGVFAGMMGCETWRGVRTGAGRGNDAGQRRKPVIPGRTRRHAAG